MVALELANILGIQHVALFGSAVSYKEINPFLRSLRPLAALTPLKLCAALAGKSSHLLTDMYAQQDPEFMRAMLHAVTSWEYTGNANVMRVHGRSDHVIHCTSADHWLDGGHLLAMTHEQACVDIFADWRQAVQSLASAANTHSNHSLRNGIRQP